MASIVLWNAIVAQGNIVFDLAMNTTPEIKQHYGPGDGKHPIIYVALHK
jgi:hypothetical protein